MVFVYDVRMVRLVKHDIICSLSCAVVRCDDGYSVLCGVDDQCKGCPFDIPVHSQGYVQTEKL